MTSRHPGTTTQPASGVVYPQAPQVQCDLCESPMLVPDYCIRIGRIEGLLTCSACVEDILESRQLENAP